ncbi:MAG: STAS domain-containing protein [Terracidiphilus sp.]|jgi:anti-anti-sigma factor
MTSVMFNPEVADRSLAEWAGAHESTEISGLTELVRGRDQRLLDRLTPLVRRQSLILDLHSVERIDAAGIAALITLYRAASETGHRFAVSCASQRVAEILSLVGLKHILLSQNAIICSHSGDSLRRSAA